MKKNYKSFSLGALTALLIVSLFGTASATYGKVQQELEYRDIGVTLNGTKLNLKDATGKPVEPFMFNGTNYLPVRALAESLGLSVKWDGASNTVVLTGEAEGNSISNVQLLGFYKILQDNLDYLYNVFNNLAFNINYYTTESQSYELRTATIQNISESLELTEGHYANCSTSGLISISDIELMSNYRRLANKAVDNLNTLSGNSWRSYADIISGSAQQNQIDTLISSRTAENQFWSAYQSAFQ